VTKQVELSSFTEDAMYVHLYLAAICYFVCADLTFQCWRH